MYLNFFYLPRFPKLTKSLDEHFPEYDGVWSVHNDVAVNHLRVDHEEVPGDHAAPSVAHKRALLALCRAIEAGQNSLRTKGIYNINN